MKCIKGIVAMMAVVMMVVSNGANSVTVWADVTEETKLKGYGPVNIETVSLSDEDIPDALIDSGEVRKEIKDKYVKRLYSEEKDLNTLMFENEAGERTMYLFKKPVKYKDENGNVVDKDISFKKLDESYKAELRDRYVCHNGDNDVKVYMPRDISDGIRIMTDNKAVQMSVKVGDTVSDDVEVSEEAVTYEEAFGKGTELKYTPMLDGIKEEIILQEYTGQTEFSFEVRLDGYKLVTLDDNCLYLENVDNGYIEGIIDSVYMIDDNGVTDFNNYYTYVEKNEGVYEVTAHVNEEFLTDEGTQYPVVIDPTIWINKDEVPLGIYDATLNSTSTTEGQSGSLFVGNRSNGENGISRVAMKFPGLQFDTENGGVSVVLSASISIRDLLCETTEMEISCYALGATYPTWTEDNVSWNMLNMNNKPFCMLLDTKKVSYSQGLKQEEAHTYKFDITSAVIRWREGNTVTSAERGIVFCALNENAIIHKTFGSYNRASYNPVFKMSYVPYYGGYTYDEFDGKIQRYVEHGQSITQYPPNCIGLSLFCSKKIAFGEIGVETDSEKLNVEHITNKICEYVMNDRNTFSHIKKAEKIKCGLDETESYNLNENQYLIAIRVGYGYENAIDLHGMVQMNNGQWIDKHGVKNRVINNWGYINPDENGLWWITEEYKDGDTSNDRQGYCYYSETAYIKITTVPKEGE